WGPWMLARHFYDTYETALTLGAVSESGTCMDCGGKRSPKRCACSPETPVPARVLQRESDQDRRAAGSLPGPNGVLDFLRAGAGDLRRAARADPDGPTC